MTNKTNLPMVLSPDSRGNYVTWSKGKRQIRGLLTQNGYKTLGLFRARKINKNEFSIQASKEGIVYDVTAARLPGIALEFTLNLGQ